ncbi:ExbD/TolR family protein [Alkalimarinus sediminis]|uniref:Biopolymer transporter ExbD n=1 Tax=Alkalimarinus sediminis TaxID=1632866 RepID=A0A9E8KKD3_9ALTE|nr:biopolymer transporter ExbD [Alkalimarinus sediminis]UZW76011.1 biopolymer transporter ExbD [Alkalimarinus sediminis]
MKVSRRANRMKRHYGRMHKTGGLNLVSLMDIFTILVFFLMVNSSDVKVLQQNPSIKLPESTANVDTKETLVLTIVGSDILIQGRKVADLNELSGDEQVITGIKSELEYQASRNRRLLDENANMSGLPITIMGDKDIPYRSLKKIMESCVAANYTNISLAVSRAARKEEG